MTGLPWSVVNENANGIDADAPTADDTPAGEPAVVADALGAEDMTPREEASPPLEQPTDDHGHGDHGHGDHGHVTPDDGAGGTSTSMIVLALLGVLAGVAGLIWYAVGVTPEDDEVVTEGSAVTSGESLPEGVVYSIAGVDRTLEDVEPRVRSIAPDLADALVDPEAATAEQRGQLAQVVATLVVDDLLGVAAEDAGVEVTEEDLQASIDEIVDIQFGGDAAAFETQVEAEGLTVEAVRELQRPAVLIDKLVDARITDITDEEVEAFYEQESATEIVSHILVETEDEAQAVVDRLDAGEAFADVAAEVSIDGSAQSGGQLGPFQPGQFVEPFENAVLETEPGEITGPVETEFGWHVITIDGADIPPLDEARPDIEEFLRQQQVGGITEEIVTEIDAAAQVTVAPVYGTWLGITGGGVQPPVSEVQDLELPDEALPLDDLPTERE